MTKPTMEEYIAITRINQESGNERGMIELKGRFLIKLTNNAFSETNGEDAVEQVKKFLKIVDSLNVPNVSHDRLSVSIFPVSLTGALSEWFKDDSIGSITKWVDLANRLFGKFYPPSRAGRKVETKEVNNMILWDGTDTKKKVMTNEELSYSEDGNLNEEEEIAQVFRIDTDIFHFDTPLSLEESNPKDEALKNKVALEESMNREEESTDVNSNYNPYFDISRLFNDHTTKNDDKDVQDEMELNNDEDDDVGYLDDYMVHKNVPFIINKEEDRSKEEGANYLGFHSQNWQHAKRKGLR
nr:hypothetical protein [Tanacetum cinerariifolium]